MLLRIANLLIPETFKDYSLRALVYTGCAVFLLAVPMLAASFFVPAVVCMAVGALVGLGAMWGGYALAKRQQQKSHDDQIGIDDFYRSVDFNDNIECKPAPKLSFADFSLSFFMPALFEKNHDRLDHDDKRVRTSNSPSIKLR